VATRFSIAASVIVGTCAAFGSIAGTPSARAGVPAPQISLQWSSDLNDAPCGVAEASPALFSANGTPAVEVGDREGSLYAFNLVSGTASGVQVPGWSGGPPGQTVGSGQGCGASGVGALPATGDTGIELPELPPVDSTASVAPGSNDLFFGAGNAASPGEGGYYGYAPDGSQLWNQVVTNPPTVTQQLGGVQASLALADGGSTVNGGSLGQETYSLATGSGAPNPGWPFFSADSVFSTAAVGDLYGTGQSDFVVGGASSDGFAYGKHYQDGGHLRILNDHSGLICAADTTEQIDSSPAVGPILPGGAYGIATGTGSFWADNVGPQSDDDTVKVYDTTCHQVWSDTLDGFTGGSPALADLLGNGRLAVVEGTVRSDGSGSVYALDAATGAALWPAPAHLPGAVFGSVTTADFGTGYQDVVVGTDLGLFVLDGRTGAIVADLDDGNGNAVTGNKVIGFQNAPLVTADPGGLIGITVAGYFGVGGTSVQGVVQHFEVQGTNGALVNEPGAWPQFHHDAQLSGFVGGGTPLGLCTRPAAASNGYQTVASDGGIFAFGQDFCGSTGGMVLNKPVVGMAAVPGQGGYWLVASDGGIFSYGDAGFYGSTGSLHLNAPVVAMAATPDGQGYWLVASDGGIFSYGDAQFYGSAASVPGQDIVGMASSPDGQGYWEVSTTGRVFTFGDAQFSGDTSAIHLNAVIVGMTPDPVTGGYWLIGSDGGVFSFGAPFFGSTGAIRLNQPVVAMQSTGDGQGYWFVARDGGVFAYGDAPFRGSMGGQHLNQPMVGMFGF
jgi:hypothetical protein